MALSRQQSHQFVNEAALAGIGQAARTQFDVITPAFDAEITPPLKLYGAIVPDSKLYIGPSQVANGDGTARSVPPQESAVNNAWTLTTIDFGVTSSWVAGSGTVTRDGATFSLPTITATRFLRMAFVLKSDGTVDSTASDGTATTRGTLPNAGTLFATLDGIPLGWIDLVALTGGQTYKTADSAGVSSVIQNSVSSSAQIVRFGSGGAGSASVNDFKISAIATSTATIKGGRGILLASGLWLKTYDGSGTLSTDYGKDLSVNLTTILGASPANATAYFLYVDKSTLTVATTTDTFERFYGVQQANFVLLTTAPESTNLGRYIPCTRVTSATTGTAWTGTGSSFAALPTLTRFDGPLAISPVAYRLTQQAVGAVGSSGQVVAGHTLSTKSFPSAVTGSLRSWYNLADGSGNALDGSGNARTLTNNGTTPYTGTGILGAANTAALLVAASSQSFSSAASFFNPGDTSFAFGIWAKGTWANAGSQTLVSQFTLAGNQRSFELQQSNNASVTTLTIFVSTDGTSTNNRTLTISVPQFASGSYHHFGWRYDATTDTTTIFVDGKAAGQLVGVAPFSVSSLDFRIGSRGAGAQFFDGTLDEFCFVNGALLTDEDMRKLYAYRVDHAKSVSPVNQDWDATIGTTCTTEDAGSWLVDKTDRDAAFWDFSDLASTDTVAVVMSDTGLSAVVVQARQPFDTIYASGTAANTAIGAGLAHGQGEVPYIFLQREVATGEWESMDATGKIRADATNLITEDLTVITERIRVRAVGGTLPTAAGLATASTAGLVKGYAPDLTLGTLSPVADHTMTANDGITLVRMTNGGSNRTTTLPGAATCSGREITFKKIDAGNTYIIDGNGAETIDGATTTELTEQYASVRLRSNGTSWDVVG